MRLSGQEVTVPHKAHIGYEMQHNWRTDSQTIFLLIIDINESHVHREIALLLVNK